MESRISTYLITFRDTPLEIVQANLLTIGGTREFNLELLSDRFLELLNLDDRREIAKLMLRSLAEKEGLDPVSRKTLEDHVGPLADLAGSTHSPRIEFSALRFETPLPTEHNLWSLSISVDLRFVPACQN